MLNSDQQARIAVWRAKALDGALTAEDMKEAISLLREGRLSAMSATTPAERTKARKAIPSADDLLSEIEDF